MKNDEMFELCKKVVVDYFNENVEKTDELRIDKEKVFIV